MSLLYTAGLSAQETYGTYRYPEVEAPFKEEAERWSDDLLQDLNDSLQVIESELMAMYRLFIREDYITPQKMNRLENELRDKTTEVENFRINAQARYVKDRKENDSLIRENITLLIHRFMKENKLLFLSQQDKVIVCNVCKDYTKELIAGIHRQKASAATAADR